MIIVSQECIYYVKNVFEELKGCPMTRKEV